jgi:hypothetical protein
LPNSANSPDPVDHPPGFTPVGVRFQANTSDLQLQIYPGPAREKATSPAAAPNAEQPAPVHYTPGKGFALQAGDSSFRLWDEAKRLGFSRTSSTFNPGQPLIVRPKDTLAALVLAVVTGLLEDDQCR